MGCWKRTFPWRPAHHGVPNQLTEKSHDYNFLNFCKDTKPFSFTEDKLQPMWLCIASCSHSFLFSHCTAFHHTSTRIHIVIITLILIEQRSVRNITACFSALETWSGLGRSLMAARPMTSKAFCRSWANTSSTRFSLPFRRWARRLPTDQNRRRAFPIEGAPGFIKILLLNKLFVYVFTVMF